MNRMSGPLGRARGLLAGFTNGQRGVIVVAVLALVLGAVGLSRWAAQPTWTPLFYSGISEEDATSLLKDPSDPPPQGRRTPSPSWFGGGG